MLRLGLWLLLLGGWALAPLTAPRAATPTAELRQGLLALDPERISAQQVRELLSLAPAPRVLLFKGSLGADMESFGAFLQAMGYPAQRLRNPASGRYSYSFRWEGCRCDECEVLAGSIGTLVRSEGVAPVLVGHSGGGVTVGRVLQQLAADADAPRLPFAATLGTGALLRWIPGFPGCAADVPQLGRVPASVTHFTGYRIDGDPFTALLGFGEYRPAAAGDPPAQVRNVRLPASVSHVRAFEVDGYAEHPQLRAWIDAYQPGSMLVLPDVPGLDLDNLHHAADLWHSLKKHWALQARQWAAQAGAVTD
jgi:hypothetical protein